LYNYKKNKKLIIQSEIHVGNYKDEYQNQH
jgi:hypothetical protein